MNTLFYDSLSGIPFSFPEVPLPGNKRYAFQHPLYQQQFSTIQKVLLTALNQRIDDPNLHKLCVCALAYSLSQQENPVILIAHGGRISGEAEKLKEILNASRYCFHLTAWGRTKVPKLRITGSSTIKDLVRWADLINDLKFTRLEKSEFEQPTTIDEKLAQKWKKFRAYSATPWKMPAAFVSWIEKKYEIPARDPDWKEILDSGVLFKPVQELYIENSFANSIYKAQHLLDLIHLIRDYNAEKSCLLSFMIVKWLQEKLKAWTDFNPDLAVELFMSEIGSVASPSDQSPTVKAHVITPSNVGDILENLKPKMDLSSILKTARKTN